MKPYLKYLLEYQQKTFPLSQKGLTLVEALAAIVITTVIMTAMAPPLLFSAATRVQSQKFEQAQGTARQELDRVKAALSRSAGVPQSEETGMVPPESSNSTLSEAAPPTEIITDRSNLDDPSKALAFDADGDGENDFFVQLIRDQGVRFSAGEAAEQLAVFQIGIRVYDIAAEDNLGSLNVEPASLQMTQALGERTTNPLAVSYTEISRSDLKLSLQEYREYICQVDSELELCS